MKKAVQAKSYNKSGHNGATPPTDIHDAEYFHKVVDCQYACPAHTPVPEYIRLIATGRYTDAYLLNWESNVFPGVLGRTCDRPCEPACRRGRVDKEPVAICRLKRVAADHKDDISQVIPKAGSIKKNGRKIALIGAGPASLTVARDLLPLGYDIDIYDENAKGGGFMRSQIPSFRLPETVLDEEVNYILDMGAVTHFNRYVESLREVLESTYDAIFVGTGAPNGKDLDLPGRKEADANIHIGINWLGSVAFEHTKSIGKRVIVLGGGNTAMDCCRTARRLGGEDVKVVVRSPFADMKASDWEKEDAVHEDIPILDNHVPKEFLVSNNKLVGVKFEKVTAVYSNDGSRKLVTTGDEPVIIECDDVLMAIGQENAFPWIEKDLGIEFDKWDVPVINSTTFQSTIDKVFFGGDAAFGPENIITAVAHGHQAAISIHHFCDGVGAEERLAPGTNLVSQKMGVHEWMYSSAVTPDERYIVAQENKKLTLRDRKMEVELGFDAQQALAEAERCLNCDVQTVFSENLCIECDACVDICPTDCITFTGNSKEPELRGTLKAPANNLSQDIYVSNILPTERVMVKDENVCLHCGLCAERCPTAAWDMQKFLYNVSKAGEINLVDQLIAVQKV